MKRKVNKSKSFTTKQYIQATDVMISLVKIAKNVVEQANSILPQNRAHAILAIQRIGFNLRKETSKEGRTFEVFKQSRGKVSIRVKASNEFSLYHWRWSIDGINWVRLSDSTVASVIIAGFSRGTHVIFQSAQTKKTKGIPLLNAYNQDLNWSDGIGCSIIT